MSQKPTYEELKKRVKEYEQAELKHRQCEEELTHILSMFPDMICIANIQPATFIKVNSAFTETLGLSEEELLEKPFLDFVHPDDIEATQSVIEQELRMGTKIINFENRYRCKDGSYRWLSWVSHPDLEQGLMYAVARDITKQKYNEEELKKGKALLDATGRMSKVGGWELDLDSQKVFWTKMTGQIHELPDGYFPDLDEAITFYHPDDRKLVADSVKKAIETGESYDIEARLITANGRQRWVRAIGQPTFNDGECVGLTGAFQDISAQKASEFELRRRIAYERLLSKISSEFAGVAGSHVDRAIKKTLSTLCGFTGADRGYVFQFSNNTTVNNIHEWCAKGIEPQIENLQDIGVEEELPWFINHLKRKEIFHVSDVASLPEKAQLEQVHFESQSIKSVIAVPIQTGENLVGFLRFDAVGKHRTWSNNDKKLLQYFSQTLCHILEQQRTEMELRKSEFVFKQTFEQSSTSTCFYDPEGTIIRVNDEFCRMFGVKEEDIINSRYNIFSDQALIEAGVIPVIQEIFENKKKKNWEIEFDIAKTSASSGTPTTKPEKIFLKVFGYPVVNRINELEFIVLKHYDITQHKHAENLLIEANLKQQEAIKAGNVGLWDWDLETNKVHYSKEWKQQIGYQDHEIGDAFEEWRSRVHPDDLGPSLEKVEQSIALGHHDHNMEFRFRHRDGSYRWIMVQASFLRVDGRPVRMLGAHIDITERKKAERQNMMLKTAIDQAPVGIALADEDISIYYCNPEGLGMRGGQTDDLEKIPKDTFNHWQVYMLNEEPYEIENLPLVRAIKRGETIREELIIRHHDGVDHICDAIACPVFENEKVIGGMLIFLDISARKQALDKLKESEKKLYTIIDQNPFPIALTDIRDEKIIYWSQSALDTFGHNPKTVSEWYELAYPDPEYRAQVLRRWKPFLKKISETHKAVNTGEYQIVCKDGTTKICEILIQSIPGNMVVTLNDITERKNIEKEIIQQRNKAELYLNLASVMFIGLDASGTIEIANQKACDILECNKQDIIGLNWFDEFIPSRIRDEVRSVFAQLMREEVEPVEYFQNPVLTKNGDEKQIFWHNTIIRGDDNTIIGILGSGEDMTEKINLQQQLIQAQKMEAIGTLAGGIAHDFNNILSSVLGFTELSLIEVEQGSIVEDNLQEVYKAGKRAKELVGQILAFARQAEEKLSPIQIDIIAKEVLKFIRSSIPTFIAIKSNINCDSFIMGNQTQIHQILMNLCTNAAHAMEDEGGILDVCLKDVIIDSNFEHQKLGLAFGNYLALSVSDTGTGISPDIINSIFDPYFTTKAQGEGTGMGLSVVHGIIESYGGKIVVESRLGQGTTFSAYIPVIKKRGAWHEHKIEPLPEGEEHILLVDDEAPITRIGVRHLESLGYMVTAQTNSVEALELFKSKPYDFDLVISDMTMPNMTGDVLAAELMAIRPEIPVVLCTGYSKKLSKESAAEIGIKAVVYKPIVKADLAKIVRKVLDEAIG